MTQRPFPGTILGSMSFGHVLTAYWAVLVSVCMAIAVYTINGLETEVTRLTKFYEDEQAAHALTRTKAGTCEQELKSKEVDLRVMGERGEACKDAMERYHHDWRRCETLVEVYRAIYQEEHR